MSRPSEKSELEKKLHNTKSKQAKVLKEQQQLSQLAAQLQSESDRLKRQLHELLEQNLELVQGVEHGVNDMVRKESLARLAHERANSMLVRSPESSPIKPGYVPPAPKQATPLPTPSQYLDWAKPMINSPNIRTNVKKNLFGDDSNMEGRKRRKSRSRRSRSRKSCNCRW